MLITRCLGLALLAVVCESGYAAADSVSDRRPRVGEVRALAITLSDEDVVSFHRGGWLEARGQLLWKRAFPELFKAIGRTWTPKNVTQDRFAIPEIRDRSQRETFADSPSRVLGLAGRAADGDAEKALRQAPVSYWIFVGQDVSQVEATAHNAPVDHAR
jgi:hypothetical protein